MPHVEEHQFLSRKKRQKQRKFRGICWLVEPGFLYMNEANTLLFYPFDVYPNTLGLSLRPVSLIENLSLFIVYPLLFFIMIYVYIYVYLFFLISVVFVCAHMWYDRSSAFIVFYSFHFVLYLYLYLLSLKLKVGYYNRLDSCEHTILISHRPTLCFNFCAFKVFVFLCMWCFATCNWCQNNGCLRGLQATLIYFICEDKFEIKFLRGLVWGHLFIKYRILWLSLRVWFVSFCISESNYTNFIVIWHHQFSPYQ